jgi:hypothetical protein
VNRGLLVLLASIVVSATLGESTESTKIRITTWNLQWFPSGSAKEASTEQQNQRINAGYQNGFEGLALSERVTHPGTHGFPDATFDFIFAKGLTALQPTIIRTSASDHWPVTRDFRLQ